MASTTSRRAAMSVAAAAAATALALAACGRSATGGAGNGGTISPTKGLVVTTKPGTKPISSVTWAVYRDVNSLDPIYAFDYPENTAVSLMCESLLKQSPAGGIGPGLATMTSPSPTKLVFTINKAATFWDGKPVTPADVVYSLDRNTNTSLGGFYGLVFSRVKSIAATGSDQVTITLKQPDYWLPGELASMPGIVIEKAFATKQGKKFGTPSGSIMCTGAYKLQSFTPGVGVTAVPNTNYWQPSVKPLVSSIIIKGVASDTSLTSGLTTNAIQGTFTSGGLSTLPQLEQSGAVKIYRGQGWSTDAFIVSSTKGVLGDVRVREARLRQGLQLLAAAPVQHHQGQEAGQGGRGDRQDAHDRHLKPDREHRPGDRRVPGRGQRDRAEDRPQVGLRAELHQLLHRPQGQDRD